MATSPSSPHWPAVDLLKAAACQLIVLHHLCFYGPMADHARPLAPALIDWLADPARMAVQVFLVVAGFLAAQSLSRPQALAHPVERLFNRYLRLVVPYAAALLFAVLANALAGQWMTHDSLSAPPTLGQGLAHLLLVQDVLGVDALSAGVWYVAIDLQLYALVMLCLWLPHTPDPQRRQQLGIILLVAVGLASLLVFNRMPQWDSWAVYFAGSYVTGMAVWWLVQPGQPRWGIAVLAAIMALALWMEFRHRIALAGGVALLLWIAARHPSPWRWLDRAPVRWLAEISYSVFLIHFPVTLLVNAGFERWFAGQALPNLAGMLLAWGLSLLAGWALHCILEVRVRPVHLPRWQHALPAIRQTWLKSRRQPASPAIRPAGAGQAPVRG
ncbi:acyltransferase family protein [Laribacter hongkongensis]|uniref:acyltransferase family protein n=1 Tax=Laribacter hongkongensis TaxID=168471 RepID=UPI001EFDC425|nr:acyltransferase [Laribacter hongkongensis]MCG9080266.1 acyltransferase [Laribacter hongkongensis]